jgi:hypothetical protein
MLSAGRRHLISKRAHLANVLRDGLVPLLRHREWGPCVPGPCSVLQRVHSLDRSPETRRHGLGSDLS